jgi:hypothetical protein
MAYFGGANDDRGQRKEYAHLGAHADPKVQAERDRVRREMEAENAAEWQFAEDNFSSLMKRVSSSGPREDDDIMDEEAGRRRLELAAESKANREAQAQAMAVENDDYFDRIKAVKSRVGSRNQAFSQAITTRRQNEKKIAALLEGIRQRVQDGTASTDRDSIKSLEKELAKAQTWVCAPPTAENERFHYKAPPNGFLEWGQAMLGQKPARDSPGGSPTSVTSMLQ